LAGEIADLLGSLQSACYQWAFFLGMPLARTDVSEPVHRPNMIWGRRNSFADLDSFGQSFATGF
jgi:hypothetical protein